MATPAQRTNTWTLDEWYDQSVAGTTGGYQWGAQLWSWGYNRDGSGALNDKTKRSSPTQVGTNTNWKFVSGNKNGYKAFGTKKDGTLWAWGQNSNGILGINLPSNSHRSSPIQVPGTYKYALCSDRNSFFLKDDGTLWTSGWNSGGRSGLNEADGTKRSSPAQIGTESTWKSINAGRQNAGGIKTDGTLWMWGTGSAAMVINNASTPGISSPSQIPGTTWKYVAFGNYSGAAVKTDGTLWMWGDNGQGTLGVNSGPGGGTYSSGASSPIQVGTNTNWDLVDMAFTESETRSIFATKTDGSFWVWGSATQCMRNGLNGPGPGTKRSSPTQLPGTYATGFGDAGYRPQFYCDETATAKKADGTMWIWGRGSTYGGLGLNDAINRSSPTQLPGTNWIQVKGGQSNCLAIRE